MSRFGACGSTEATYIHVEIVRAPDGSRDWTHVIWRVEDTVSEEDGPKRLRLALGAIGRCAEVECRIVVVV